MKRKIPKEKLSFSKQTVVNLGNADMTVIKGGYETEIAVYCESIVCSVVETFCDGLECVTRFRTICD
jgi:hypothetical protein